MTTAPPAEQHPQSSTEIVGRVRARIDDLCRPRRTTTLQWVPVPGAVPPRLVQQSRTVTLPPLLVQLAGTLPGGSSGRGSSSTEGRPPGSLVGVDTLRTIEREARYLAQRTLTLLTAESLPGVRLRMVPVRVSDSLQVLTAYADQLDRGSLLDLDAAVRRWWASARVATTWDSPALRPWVPCPACLVRGKLRVVDSPLVVLCLECHQSWDGLTVGQLGEHMRIALSPAIDTPTSDLDSTSKLAQG